METMGNMGASRPQTTAYTAREHSYSPRSSGSHTASAGTTHSYGSAGTRSASGTKRTSGGSSQSPKKKKRRRRRFRKNQRFLFFVAACLLVVAVIVLVTAIVLANSCKGSGTDKPDPDASPDPSSIETTVPVTDSTVIENSVTVDGVPLRGLTIREARTRLVQKLEEKMNSLDITVAYESYEPLQLTAETIGLSYEEADVDEALRKAAAGEDVVDSIPMHFDGELLRNALYGLNEKIPNHAINAQAEVKYKTNKIDGVKYYQPYWSYTEGQNGAKIDFDGLEKQIDEAIARGDYTASLTPSVTVSEPEITVDALKSQLTLLGSYSTSYYFTGTTSTDPALVENRQGRDTNIKIGRAHV